MNVLKSITDLVTLNPIVILLFSPVLFLVIRRIYLIIYMKRYKHIVEVEEMLDGCSRRVDVNDIIEYVYESGRYSSKEIREIEKHFKWKIRRLRKTENNLKKKIEAKKVTELSTEKNTEGAIVMNNGIETATEVLEAKEKFAKLAKTASLEEFKKEASDYFDERDLKYMDAIDFAWGDTLMIACEMRKRLRIRRERMEKANSTEEAFAGMFSSV